MNTTENEIQALHKEIDDLRNENIALYNELTKQNKILFEQIISIGKELANQQAAISDNFKFIRGQSLSTYLTLLTGMNTAKFIITNMNKAKVINDKNNYLKYVLSQVDVSGSYLEFGVYQGSTINLISATLPDKIVYGFDSFEGLPETWRSGFYNQAFNMNGNLPQINKNVCLIKGWFNETLPNFVKEHPDPCAFIHVDCDLYSSTKTIFDNLKNQIIRGTVIAFDEYFYYPGWQEGEYKAFMELVKENDLKYKYIARTEHQQVAIKIL